MKIENEQRTAENIRNSYLPKEATKLDELRRLDKKVTAPAEIFAYIFGVIGTLVLGVGMCLALKVIGGSFVAGIVVGIVGIAMISVNYFAYNKLLKARRKKYEKQILALTDELLAK